VLAGFYDADPSRIVGWLSQAAKYKGTIGVMYTTWTNDYKPLEKWLDFVKGFPENAKDIKPPAPGPTE
jgi:hypothetical protein